MFEQPINYLTSAGVWAPIDDTLQADPAAGAGAVSNVRDADRVTLPGTLTASPVQVSYGSATVGFSTAGARAVVSSVHGNEATYANVLPDTTVHYFATPTGVSDRIVLRSAHAPSTFTFPLRLSGGLRPRRAVGGGIEFVGASGRVSALRIAPAIAYDAAGPAGSIGKRNVRMRLVRRGRGWAVVVEVSRRWLDAPGRRFPVTVDPTVSTQTQGDCMIANGAYANSSFCTAGYMELGSSSGVTGRILLGFQLPTGSSAIPQDAIVTQASIGVDFAAGTAASNAGIYSLTHAPSGASTWNTYDGTHAWSTPGGDYFPVPYDNETVQATAGYTSWFIDLLAQKWINYPGTNFGVELVDDAAAMRVAYNTLSGYGSGTWPVLTISWLPRLGTPAASPIVSIPTADEANMAVNAANGNLDLSTPAMHVNGDRLDFDLGTEWESLGAGYPTDSGGGTASQFDFNPGPMMQLSFFWSGSPSGPVGNFEVETPDGEVRAYAPGYALNGGVVYTTPGLDSQLFWNGSYWVLYMTQQRLYYFFNTGGYLVYEVDNDADTIAYNWGGSYAGLPQLSSITDTQGRTITPSYNGSGEVTGWSDSAGGSVSYAVNGSGQLGSWSDPAGNQTSYGYDAGQDVNQITDPDGNVTTLTYDSQRRVTQITRDPAGLAQTWTISYSPTVSDCTMPASVPASSVDYMPAINETKITDPDANTTIYCTDAADRTVETIDPAVMVGGVATTYVTYTGYDPSDDVTGSTELNRTAGNTIVESSSASYCGSSSTSGTTGPSSSCPGLASGQAASNPTSSSIGAGSFSLSEGTASYGIGNYGAYLPSATTDTQGNATSYTYDASGNLTQLTDALNPAGSYQNASQSTMSYAYQTTSGYPAELLTASSDPDGHQTSYGYFTNGNLQTITPPSPRLGTSYSYDALSRVQTSTDGDFNVTSYTYNPDNQLTKTTYWNAVGVVDT